jgi:hypothetical protein
VVLEDSEPGFFIADWEVDQDHWTEGYVSGDQINLIVLDD